MISLAANLDEVIARVTRLRDERIPAAMTGALAPRLWKDEAIATAAAILNGIPKQPGEEKHVAAFVKAVYVTFIDGLVIGLAAPNNRLVTVAAQLSLPGEPNQYAELALADANAEMQFEQMLQDWVENEKRWDEAVDGPKTEENIRAKAEFISHALVGPGGEQLLVKAGPHAGQPVREVFLPHILEYIGQKNENASQAGNLDAATAGIWLNAVLQAWSKMVRAGYRGKVKQILFAGGTPAGGGELPD